MVQEKALLKSLQCTHCQPVSVLFNMANFKRSGGRNFFDCHFDQDKVKESHEA